MCLIYQFTYLFTNPVCHFIFNYVFILIFYQFFVFTVVYAIYLVYILNVFYVLKSTSFTFFVINIHVVCVKEMDQFMRKLNV